MAWFMNNKNNFKIDWKVIKPEGGYFIMADIRDCVPMIKRKYFY